MADTPDYAYGQDEARGILAVNPYAEGSEEWHGWGHGYDYAVHTGGAFDYPLSGEWADQMTMRELFDTVAVAIFGEFEAHGVDCYDMLDSDVRDAILQAFEHGYAAYRAGWRI